MDITEVSIIHHVALVLLLLWIFAFVGWSHPLIYLGSLIYLFRVNEHYNLRLQRRLQFEERKNASQRRLLSDTESVRWLNHAVAKIWPICMERIASQQFLLPVIPWFLDKYKPWTARKAAVQHLYLGRNPPMFTEIRVLRESPDDDHLVLELGMSFLAADDMSAILAVHLRKRVGGISAKLHMTGMHVEGKVLVGVKFLRHWPFLGRVRICFVEQPYVQMTVKPLFSHGIDVTELPGIAGWLDKILAVAFEQTLVEPNMMVIDVEKFASAPTENWFTVDEKRPLAFVKVDILEAADMKPSDMNGLADPYVKGQLGPYRFQTKIQRKTLSPKWLEEFRIPVTSWELPNVLVLQVRDKDHIFDDSLGGCSLNINDLRGGQRHDKWLTLRNVKMGRLHLAITILEDVEGKDVKQAREQPEDDEQIKSTEATISQSNTVSQNNSKDGAQLDGSHKLGDEFEPIDIEGQEKTGVWVHHPGSDVRQTWEPRKGRVRRPETLVCSAENDCSESPRSQGSGRGSVDSSSEDNREGNIGHRPGTIHRGLRKLGSLFSRRSKLDTPRANKDIPIPSPRPNLRAVGEKGIAVKLIVDDVCVENIEDEKGVRKSPRKHQDESYVKSQLKDNAQDTKLGSKSFRNLKSTASKKSYNKLKEQPSELEEMDAGSERYDSSNDMLKDYPLLVEGSVINPSSLGDYNEKSIKSISSSNVKECK